MTTSAAKKPIETVREVPAYLPAEHAVLGALLLESERYPEVWSMVEADDFSLESHQRIWLRMWELHSEGKAVDLVTTWERLERNKDDVGGHAYLADLIHGLPRRPVLKDYLQILREKRKLRAIILSCQAAIESAFQHTESAAIVHTLRENLKAGKLLTR